jgi:hypothetical protein
MIIKSCTTFRAADVSKYAWGRLGHFQNVDAVTKLIVDAHDVPKDQHKNVKTQATELRQCLMQAREYYDAASTVGPATRPVLLYYSIMSMALCEVLFKQDGNSRLEKLREVHGCHGLALSLADGVKPASTLEECAEALRAKPQTAPDGSARGTFEVWRKSSREWPVVGRFHQTMDNFMQTSMPQTIMGPSDVEPDRYPATGRSLLDVLKGMPQMAEFLEIYGIIPDLVRATCSARRASQHDDPILHLTVHPTVPHLASSFNELVSFAPRGAMRVLINDYPTGVGLSFPLALDTPFQFPWAICTDLENTWFATRKESLNEFGLLYVALHIAGNFARYYPDKWLAHIEASSPLALTIDRLTDVAFERTPLLLLGELSQRCFVAAS